MPMFCGTVYPNLPTGLWTIHRNYNQVVSHRERQWLGWCLCFVGQFILTYPQDCEQSIEIITKFWAIGKGSGLADAYVLWDSLAWEWSPTMTTHVYLWWPGTPVPSLSCLLVRTPSSFLHMPVLVCVCVHVFLVCVFSVCACVCVGGGSVRKYVCTFMCVHMCVCGAQPSLWGVNWETDCAVVCGVVGCKGLQWLCISHPAACCSLFRIRILFT